MPALDDLAVFDDQDKVRSLNGGETVGDDHRRAITEQSPEALLDKRLALSVEVGRGLVE